jgi:hypothetical protein
LSYGRVRCLSRQPGPLSTWLNIKNRVPSVKLGAYPKSQVREPAKHVPALGSDVALAAAHVERAAEAVELGLVDSLRVMQQGSAGDRHDRLDG